MSIKKVVIAILLTLGAILTIMGGHDIIFKDQTAWAIGFEGTELYIFTGAGIACLLAVVIILAVGAANHRLSGSVTAPVAAKQEYYGPGTGDFNGDFGDRAGSAIGGQSAFAGAFAQPALQAGSADRGQTPVLNNAGQGSAPVSAGYATQPIPVVVPPRTNDAVDPTVFAASAETPAGAAASANPLYGGIVETKKTDYVSPYAGQEGAVNYDPAYANQNNSST